METATRVRRRTGALAVLAVWAIAVPWVAEALGQPLGVPARLEVADHVVPGALVLACCALVLHGRAGGLLALGAVAVACLAGFWITVTHVTLVPEVLHGVSPWAAALLHLSAGPPVTVLAVWTLLSDDSA